MRAGVFFLVALSATSAHALLIDDFSTGHFTSPPFAGNSYYWQTGSMPNGVRAVNPLVTSNPFSQTGQVGVNGTLTYSAQSDLDATLLVAYGYLIGSSTPASNPLNLDLSTSPFFRVTFVGSDLPMLAGVSITTNGTTNFFQRTANLPGNLTNGTTVTFDFSSVAASLTDVDVISFGFNTEPGASFEISRFEVVPEPASLAALGFGLAALMRRKRKRD